MNRLLLTILACLLSLPSTMATAQVRVLTSIKPLQLIVAAVTDGVSEPEVLISGNQSYHHFTLRPSSVRAVNEAELLIWTGPDMETWLTDLYADQSAAKPVISLSGLEGAVLHPRVASAVIQQQADEHEHEHEEEQGGHHHGDTDGHAWLDTHNAGLLASAVAARLQEMDAANAARYAENLDRFLQLLAETDARSRAILQPLQGVPYAVYHNAFQYFEKQHGLRPRLIFVEDEEIQPGIRHLLALREAVATAQPVCLLEDVTSNAATVSTVLGDYRLKQQKADILGLAFEADARGYIRMLETLASDFASCLSQ